MSKRILYELTGAEERRQFSPYCWRIRMALAHKGLSSETIPWRFTDKEAIAFSGQGKVPVLIDGDHIVHDSWAIARYLEAQYPDKPALFGGAAAAAVTAFVNSWCDRVINPAIARMIVSDIHACLHETDKAYFRRTREAMFGAPLETVTADRDAAVVGFRKLLDPLRAVLKSQPYLGGDTPSYADYIPFGTFQWALCTSGFALLEPEDPVHAWRETLLDAFDGMARKALP
jgi:glutathione S-transferase